MSALKTCPTCNGEGVIENGTRRCPPCHGTGCIPGDRPSDEPRHTPGPWKAGGNGVHVGYMCVAITHMDPKEQRHADARLIAAAPELLTHLERAIETLEYWFQRWGDPEGANSEQMKLARAAIAKATGGTL